MSIKTFPLSCLFCIATSAICFGQPGDHGTLFERVPEKRIIRRSERRLEATEFAAQSGPSMSFGRLFGDSLTSFIPDADDLVELGEALGEDGSAAASNIPAVYTYLGQFVDHDITFDITPLSQNLENIGDRRNFRDPTLALDSVYGAGPAANPYLYERDGARLLVGQTNDAMPGDLPRAPTGLAIIGDPRNDENLIVAQLHLAFINAHNRIFDQVSAGSGTVTAPFELARESLAWHYQWIVINDFLGRVLDQETLNRTVLFGPQYFDVDNPVMPIEFSVAAYRFGHSMVRANYDFNANFPNSSLGQLFSFTGGGGSAPIPSVWVIDWDRFVGDTVAPTNFARPLDPYISEPLTTLPDLNPANLVVRNLLRGRSLGLPSGQSVAQFIGTEVLDADSIAFGPEADLLECTGFDEESPLWYYIMKEAEILHDGERLGPVGSTIIAETFVGLLLSDDSSYLANDRSWQPTLKLSDETPVNTLSRLIRYSRGD